MNNLFKGAIKSGVSSASALILSLPALDPDHFAISTWKGVLHLTGMIIWVTVVAEARYFKDWADQVTAVVSTPKPPPADVDPPKTPDSPAK